MDNKTRLPDGRYVPAQPLPFYNRRQFVRSLLCKLGWHRPGEESDRWFCAVCGKRVKDGRHDKWLQQEVRSEIISNIEELGHEIHRIETGAFTDTLDSLRRTKSRLVTLNKRIAAYRIDW